jgi:hypothetical protein
MCDLLNFVCYSIAEITSEILVGKQTEVVTA